MNKTQEAMFIINGFIAYATSTLYYHLQAPILENIQIVDNTAFGDWYLCDQYSLLDITRHHLIRLGFELKGLPSLEEQFEKAYKSLNTNDKFSRKPFLNNGPKAIKFLVPKLLTEEIPSTLTTISEILAQICNSKNTLQILAQELNKYKSSTFYIPKINEIINIPNKCIDYLLPALGTDIDTNPISSKLQGSYF